MSAQNKTAEVNVKMEEASQSDHHDLEDNNNDKRTGEKNKLLLLEPNCSEPMGLPLPRDEHACSVSLPTWSSVVGYEEGDLSVTTAMRCGYPRFMYHPMILQLMQVVVEKHASSGVDEEDCLLLPGKAAAIRCQAFLQQALEGKVNTTATDNALLSLEEEPTTTTTMSRIRVVSVSNTANVYAVLFPAETLAGMQAKAYWQHTGEVVSSRRAEQALQELGIDPIQKVTCGPNAPYILHPASTSSSSGYNNKNNNRNDDDGDENNRHNEESSAQYDDDNVFTQLRQRIAQWNNLLSEESVFLTPSGMASIYTGLRSARRYQMSLAGNTSGASGGRSIVYGFPYLDTLKLCSRKEFCPDGVDFFGHGNANDLALLEQVLQQHQQSGNKVCALFTEVPSNPLLNCPDLHDLRELADQYNFCLIVDDTIGNCLNVDMLSTGIADAVCTSLTKIVSGRGDAMAGSIVANPYTKKGRWMQRDLQREYDATSAVVGGDTTTHSHGLFEADARAVLHNSSDFEERNAKINETSEILADWLQEHNDVQKVWYPKYSSLYPSLLLSSNNNNNTPNAAGGSAGYGGLMSILLESHMCQRTFYDTLDVAKGPSLGTNFTLVCPYTLLAHYHELDFAMSYNVPPNLLRISVGLENVDHLKTKFDQAFTKSRLYPKLQKSAALPSAAGAAATGQRRSYSTITTTNTTTTKTMDDHSAALARIPLRQHRMRRHRFACTAGQMMQTARAVLKLFVR